MAVTKYALPVALVLLFARAHGTDTETIIAVQCERNAGNFNWDLQLSCPVGQYIRIIRALWGREEPTVDGDQPAPDRYCPDSSGGEDTLLCPWTPDAQKIVQNACMNKPSCSIQPEVSLLGDPCPGIYKYLEVEYICSNLECKCTLDSSTLHLDVFDRPNLVVYGPTQKTVLASYEMTDTDPCKFLFQVGTAGEVYPATFGAIFFNIGEHLTSSKKFARSYKIFNENIMERGPRSKVEKVIDLPYNWVSDNDKTDMHISRFGDVIKFRSTKCLYALDVVVSAASVNATLYVDSQYVMNHTGMCGNCDGFPNPYMLSGGSVIDTSSYTQEEIYAMITTSYQSNRE